MDASLSEVIGALIAVAVTAGGFLAVLKVPNVRNAVAASLGLNTQAVTDAVESLSKIVEAQGQSIDWLRKELDAARSELALAREAMKENASLRQRVAELEAQVKSLEAELHKRRDAA